jgi:hypothetical protein
MAAGWAEGSSLVTGERQELATGFPEFRESAQAIDAA